jgi:hypothetical protein
MTFLSGFGSWEKPRQSAKDAKGANKSESEIPFAIFASFADQSLLLRPGPESLVPSPGFRGFAL